LAYEEVEILDADEIAVALERLDGHRIYAISVLALATGMSGGELLGLQWVDCNLDAGVLRVERSLEETAAGLRFKPRRSMGAGRSRYPPAP
jgi:integrase